MMIGRIPLWVGSWLIASCLAFSIPAHSQSGSSAPVVGDGSSAGQSSGELFFLVEELRQEVRQLRGQLEESNHRLERLDRQARERYVDLDERLMDLTERVSEVEDGAPTGASGSSGGDLSPETVADSGSESSAPTPVEYRQPDDEEREHYAEIQHLIQEERDFDAAIDRIYDFLDDYPEGDLAVNAYYWLGEVYLAQDAHQQAKQAFRIVTSRHETHRKAPDALYKLAVAQDREGDSDAARETLDRLAQSYADSDAAALGRQYFDD